MKLFGRKTLALLLALTMMLSLCSFTAFAEGEFAITGPNTITGKNQKANYKTTAPDGVTVNWSCSPESVATIDQSGEVTAVGKGKATITAKYQPSAADGQTEQPAEQKATYDITVIVPVDSVVMGSGASASMYIGGTQTLTATVEPADASNMNINWSTSDASIANVSDSGVVTAKKPGTVTIYAISAADSTKKTEFGINVLPDTVKSAQLASGESDTMSVSYGTSLSKILDDLKKVKIDVTYTQNGHLTVTAEDWQCTPSYDPKTLSTYTFKSATYNVSVSVTVAAGVVKSSSASPNQITITKGTQVSGVGLPASATVTLENGYSLDITVGNGDTVNYEWVCGNYNSSVTGSYTFTAQLKAGKTESRFTMDASKAPKVTVTVADAILVEDTATATMSYTSKNDYIDLEAPIKDAVLKQIRKRLGTSSTYTITVESLKLTETGSSAYGAVGTGSYKTVFTVNKDLPSSGTATQRFTYMANASDGQKYIGNLTLTIYSGIYNVSGSTSTSSPIWSFSNAAKNIYDAFKTRNNGTAPDYIEFGDVYKNDDELGELRDANAGSVEGSTYSFSSSDDDYDSVYNISFVPTGKAGYFRIDYTAYYDTGSKHSSKSMSGTITIDCVEMLVIWLNDLAAGETQSLSSAAIQEQVTAILDTTGRNAKTYTLDTVTLSRPSTGTLYDGNNKKVTSSTKALDAEYVDDYTYEAPSKVTSGTLVTLKFSVKCKPDSGKSSKPASGVMLFNLIKKADITISAPANGYATLDASLFTDYCADHVRSTHKNYELCYVEFTGAPNSTAYGYLYENYKSGIYNGAKIKSPNGKKFALTDISAKDKNAYDLESVSYVPGTRNCTGGTFTIYGVKPGETIKSSTKFVKLCDGTIDFVIDGGSVSGNTKKVDLLASQTYSNFYYDLINSNVASVRFVSVTGGKLIYRDVSSQAPITPGTDVYYLGSTGYLAGRRMLSNVVFLPGYNQTSATITLKAFDAKDKSANAQYIFTIKPVTTSSFSDMNGYSSYAGSVGLMTNLGIINGVGNNKFNPTGTVTRGEWITMLYRAAGSPAVYSSVSFTDVPSWCKDAVQWAVQNGITDGIGNNKFGPDMTLDRMQIVTFMYRFAKLQGMDVSSTLYLSAYTDGNTVDTWAQPAMKWALQKGYLDPVGGKIQPKGTMTRVLVADCLARLLTK